jgi:hypothetical protein
MGRPRGTIVVAAGFLVTLFASACRRTSEREPFQSQGPPVKSVANVEGSAAAPPKSAATSFGYKGAWIAVQGAPMEKVASALHLTDLGEATWEQGIRRSYDPDAPTEGAGQGDVFDFPQTFSVFVTPPVDGWTLAVGQRLAFFRSFAFKKIKDDRDPGKLLPFLKSLSKGLGATVQYFFTHRVPEVHIWVWAEPGRILRAYGYSGERGEVLFDVGPLTPGEAHMELKLPVKSEDPKDDSKVPPDEQMVIDIARKWSVDPTALDERRDLARVGLLGTLP